MESFAVDEDGHCLTIPSTGGGERQEWHKWLQKKSNDQEGHDWDYESIMGRAVTYWNIMGGVQLLGFNPTTWPDGLSLTFFDSLKKSHDWENWIDGGYQLCFGTVEEAEKYIFRSYP